MQSTKLMKNAFRALAVTLLCVPVVVAGDNFTYLALGDSIAFGFDPNVAVRNPDNFIGYPDVLAARKHVQHVKKVVNAACPGETSGSFMSYLAPDNGCRDYKSNFGIHTVYADTQMEFSLNSAKSDKHIDLVTISIGGNDLLLLQGACIKAPSFSDCVLQGLPSVLSSYQNNLAAILTALRIEGQYKGPIVLVNYYSPNYQDPLSTGAVAALNTVIMLVAPHFDAKVADAFTTFMQATATANGNSCTAGLLIKLPDGTCDIHPSPAGRDLLADSVVKLIGLNNEN